MSDKLKTELEVCGIIVLNLCNECRKIAEGDEEGWTEGKVEGGLNQEEREACIDFLCEIYEESDRKIFEDGDEDGMQIWDVCYNLCPACSQESWRGVKMDIDKLKVGDYANGCDGYAIVKQCVHGNKYYANISLDDDEVESMIEDKEIEVTEVSDMDVDYIPCCG